MKSYEIDILNEIRDETQREREAQLILDQLSPKESARFEAAVASHKALEYHASICAVLVGLELVVLIGLLYLYPQQFMKACTWIFGEWS
jgi:hypothetical protein